MNPERLPPLDALRILESCVRNRSFSMAASELNLPPQVISHKIETLERLLKITLFDEIGRSIEPTESATTLADHVRSGLNSFAEGVSAISKAGKTATVILSVSPGFANRHLPPKLDELKRSHPDIEIQLTTRTETLNNDNPSSAIAILHGYSDWQNSQWSDHLTKRLFVDHKIVCCSSSLMKGDYPIRRAAALCGYPLLRTTHSARLWQSVLSHLDIDHPDPDGGMTFPDEEAMQEATAQGLGIGLISRADAAEGISSGRLVAPLGEAALSGMPEEQVPGFYLVYPRDHHVRPYIQNLCEWIYEQQWIE